MIMLLLILAATEVCFKISVVNVIIMIEAMP